MIAIAVDWAQAKLPAILVAWYPGQRGGTAVADVKPDRDLTIYDDVKKSFAADPGKFEVQFGASSADIRARAALTVN